MHSVTKKKTALQRLGLLLPGCQPGLKPVLATMATVLAALPLQAQVEPGALRDPAEAMRQQQEAQRRLDALEFEAMPLPPTQTVQPPTSLPGPDDGPQFPIERITVQGDAPLARIAQKAIEPHWLERPLGVTQINHILQALTQALMDAGYITSRVYVGEQNLAAGVLVVSIAPGIVEDILYNGQSIDSGQVPAGVRAALAIRRHATLRLQDIEQTVDQLNRLHINNAQVQIKPGDTPSGSIVEIINTPTTGNRYSLSVDNQGSKRTGRVRVQGSVDLANWLGAMERVSVGLSTSKETNAVFGSLSVPWGYDTVSLSASISEYQDLIGDVALVYGRSNSLGASWNRVLSRNQTSKTTLDAALTRRHSERHINNAMLAPQTLTVVRIGVDHMQRRQTSAGMMQWVASGGWTRGTRWFGANRDHSADPREAAKAQFDKLDASFSLAVPVGRKASYHNRILAQWSGDALYASEQIYAGGMQSVRGLAESALLGDRGASMRNEIAWSGLAPMALGAFTVQAQPYAFMDAAAVQTIAGKRWDEAITAGAGVRLAARNGSAELLLGRPLTKPTGVDGGWRLDARLAYLF